MLGAEWISNHDASPGGDPERFPIECDFDTFRYERLAGVGAEPVDRDGGVAAVEELDVDAEVVGSRAAASRHAEDQRCAFSAKGDEGFERFQGPSSAPEVRHRWIRPPDEAHEAELVAQDVAERLSRFVLRAAKIQ